MRPRILLLKAAAIATLFAACWPSAKAQTTEDAIKARLVGKPLYLTGSWMPGKLQFAADGQPEKPYPEGPFTEGGVDVLSVKISHNRLQLGGMREGLEFTKTGPKRVDLDRITIEIEEPANGDFDKPLSAIFVPDLASLVPMMPAYWRDYGRKHLLAPGDSPDRAPAAADPSGNASTDGKEKVTRPSANIQKPMVLRSENPAFSRAAKGLRYSGHVLVYLWVMADGTPAHLSIVKPAGLGLDEQALLAVSHYRFKPATKDGVPTTVDLYVDVNFQIL